MNQKKPAKPAFPKAIPPPTTATNNNHSGNNNATTTTTIGDPITDNTPSPSASGLTPAPQPQRSTLADWAATEEDEYIYGAVGEKRQRGGRRAKKKKTKQSDDNRRGTDWDEIYDPSRPTNVEEYLRSDERVREVQEWKAVLYAHRRRERGRRGSYESEEDSEVEERPAIMGSTFCMHHTLPLSFLCYLGCSYICSWFSAALLTIPLPLVLDQFAPPGDYSFAPPPMSPQPAAPITNDATGDDAFARRQAMSGMAAAPPPTKSPTPPPPPPPPPQVPAEPAGATIARAPVRYEAPPQPPVEDEDDDDDMDIDSAVLGLGVSSNNDNNNNPDDETTIPGSDTPRTNRPGQKGFAQRLMSKYGWTAGSGLGADSSGIVNPLQVKVEKRRKRPDAEGGGFAEPVNRAKITGGKTASSTTTAADKDQGKFGAMSEVLVLRGMLDGMDNLRAEVEGGLGQEIGEECGDKYGRVERLYIDVEGRQVFIKFTDQVSALRAVNALEGRVFNGNTIAARFWDAEKFEQGVYGV